MKSVFLSFCILSIFSSFTPGVGTAKLSCKSASGRTFFNAAFEEYKTLQNAELSIDKEKMNFSYMDRCYVTFDPTNKVFTVHMESEANGNFETLRYVELWAIPSSFKEVSTKGTTFDVMYKFNARLMARDPRKGKEYDTPMITLDCILGYSNP